MRPSLANRYDVRNVPLPLRPLLNLYAYGTGVALFFFSALLGMTVRVHVTGREHLAGHANHIFCLWHEAVPLLIVWAAPKLADRLDGAPQVWMQHPI